MGENFTRRNHLDISTNELQYQSIPPSFRLDIYKNIKEKCDNSVSEYFLYRDSSISINMKHYSLYGVDEINEYYTSDLFINLLLDIEWHQVLSIIEYFLDINVIEIESVNSLFEYHKIGYKVDEMYYKNKPKIVVNFQNLIKENEKIINSEIKYEPVKESIISAKKYLIDPTNIDIGNSIKSSIQAIEAYLKGIFKSNGKTLATLGDCIKELKKSKLPQNIIKALEQLYVYRNSGDNIGHGSPDYSEYTIEDALLCNEMAISFINYFDKSELKY